MSYTLIITLIAVCELVIISLLIFILIMVIKNKRQTVIQEYNTKIEEREKLISQLKEKGVKYEDKIKTIKTSDDFVNLYNNILSDYGSKN